MSKPWPAGPPIVPYDRVEDVWRRLRQSGVPIATIAHIYGVRPATVGRAVRAR